MCGGVSEADTRAFCFPTVYEERTESDAAGTLRLKPRPKGYGSQLVFGHALVDVAKDARWKIAIVFFLR